jgi:hypothetical protein
MHMTNRRTSGVFTGLCIPDRSGYELNTSAMGVDTWHSCTRGHDNDDSSMNMSRKIHTDWS